MKTNRFWSKNNRTYPRSALCTVWKFHDFAITQILREINFGEFRSAKIAVFANLGLLKIAKMHENQNSEPLKVLKMADFAFLESQILISRKI